MNENTIQNMNKKLLPHPDFAARLHMMRKARRLSQEQLALEIDSAPYTISTWETGRHRPSDEQLYRLLQYFGEERAAWLLEEESA